MLLCCNLFMLLKADIDAATEVVKRSTEVCSRFRRKSGFLESLHRQKNYYDDLTAGNKYKFYFWVWSVCTQLRINLPYINQTQYHAIVPSSPPKLCSFHCINSINPDALKPDLESSSVLLIPKQTLMISCQWTIPLCQTSSTNMLQWSSHLSWNLKLIVEIRGFIF